MMDQVETSMYNYCCNIVKFYGFNTQNTIITKQKTIKL